MKEVQIFLKFSNYNDDLSVSAFKELIDITPYKYWKKGDKIIVNNLERKGIYKYSTCNYRLISSYDEIDSAIKRMITTFIKYEQDIVKLKKINSIEITLTIVFESKSKMKGFEIDYQAISFLSAIGAEIEIA